jgi:hypothetical protein
MTIAILAVEPHASRSVEILSVAEGGGVAAPWMSAAAGSADSRTLKDPRLI